MDQRLPGRIAVVTGAGSGMGHATATLFHRHGASVVLADISGAQEDLARELGERAVAMHCDVRSDTDARALINAAVDNFGGLDIIANVAGAPGTLCSVGDSSDEQFDVMIDTNLRGVFHTIRAGIPALVARGGGSIVNVASMASLMGTPDLGLYGASKSGVTALTRTTAMEYAKQKIRVNAICPGMIDTPMMRGGIATGAAGVSYLESVIPFGRFGTAEEIANAILFLASDESSYITGVALPVAGGMGV
jgi:NAD(P)-dependent dehydrogenase (short-subunit alcohol dehydrogenase family)